MLEVSKEIGLGAEEKKEKFEKIKNKELSEADKVEALLELLFDNEEERELLGDLLKAIFQLHIGALSSEVSNRVEDSVFDKNGSNNEKDC